MGSGEGDERKQPVFDLVLLVPGGKWPTVRKPLQFPLPQPHTTRFGLETRGRYHEIAGEGGSDPPTRGVKCKVMALPEIPKRSRRVPY